MTRLKIRDALENFVPFVPQPFRHFLVEDELLAHSFNNLLRLRVKVIGTIPQ